jgi:hypothetical protein
LFTSKTSITVTTHDEFLFQRYIYRWPLPGFSFSALRYWRQKGKTHHRMTVECKSYQKRPAGKRSSQAVEKRIKLVLLVKNTRSTAFDIGVGKIQA